MTGVAGAFGNALLTIGGNLAEQERAEQRAADTALVSRVIRQGGTSFQSAYDAAIESGYSEDVYRQKAQSSHKTLLAALPKHLRDEGNRRMQEVIEDGALQLGEARRKKHLNDIDVDLATEADTLSGEYLNAIRSGNAEAEIDTWQRLNAVVTSRHLQTPQQHAAYLKSVKEQGDTQFAMGGLERELKEGGVTGARAYIDAYRESGQVVDPVRRDANAAKMEARLTQYNADVVRIANAQEKADKEYLKNKREATYANIVSLFNDADPANNPTQKQLDDLLAARDLSISMHKDLSSMILATGASRDVPEAVLELDDMEMADKPPEAILHTAKAMYRDGRITKAEYRSRVKAVHSQSETPEVKDYRKFVADSIATAGPLAVLDPATSQRKASAIREYNERTASGSQENPRDVADDIVQRYRLSDPGPTAYPNPRFLDGDRMDPAALERAKAATVRAFKAGGITQAQAVSEAQLIKTLMVYAKKSEERAKSSGVRR